DLFGTTFNGGSYGSGYGTVFEITETASGYGRPHTTLASFNYYVDGGVPNGLVMDAAGNLFGFTDEGGPFGGRGTVFEIAKTSDGYASTPTTLVGFNYLNGSRTP